jgi:hypothetical protein
MNPSGGYEPKIGYKTLAMEGFNQPLIWWWKSLWKYKCLAKAKIFMWLLLNNKALTWDLLQK